MQEIVTQIQLGKLVARFPNAMKRRLRKTAITSKKNTDVTECVEQKSDHVFGVKKSKKKNVNQLKTSQEGQFYRLTNDRQYIKRQ